MAIKKYLNKNIVVIPAVGKRPILKQWTTLNSVEAVFKRAKIDNIQITDEGNFGVICGYANNNLVAVDLDLSEHIPAEKKLLDEIIDAIPYSPVSKRGKKGVTLFYISDEPIISESFKVSTSAGIDILSDGRQSILPPSVHPDTKSQYQWDGLSLEEYGIKKLPRISTSYIDKKKDNV